MIIETLDLNLPVMAPAWKCEVVLGYVFDYAYLIPNDWQPDLFLVALCLQ